MYRFLVLKFDWLLPVRELTLQQVRQQVVPRVFGEKCVMMINTRNKIIASEICDPCYALSESSLHFTKQIIHNFSFLLVQLIRAITHLRRPRLPPHFRLRAILFDLNFLDSLCGFLLFLPLVPLFLRICLAVILFLFPFQAVVVL